MLQPITVAMKHAQTCRDWGEHSSTEKQEHKTNQKKKKKKKKKTEKKRKKDNRGGSRSRLSAGTDFFGSGPSRLGSAGARSFILGARAQTQEKKITRGYQLRPRPDTYIKRPAVRTCLVFFLLQYSLLLFSQSFAHNLIMQFSTVVVAAAVAASVSAANVTETDVSSTLVTITSCGPEVTDCPAASPSASANVSTYAGAANKQFAAGAVALAAGALLAL
ncbi:predicted protein [Clavispora lusitaniae ATCC 42720]|uniref:Uncharacterized protein n=2 Tax=Clavispora lusitaniae TaxID=36911 RepID=C4YB44_CLAL4|nr:uncharacterized protein CLUG_05336 [Clavispora lusitaniae ATCC 42720]EEQ41208.1 predicted protein [Clavispora lusitaniae ATCC 42720]